MSEVARLLSEVTQVEEIATGGGVRLKGWLNKTYGRGRWRKMKAVARVELLNGTICLAEVQLVRGPRGGTCSAQTQEAPDMKKPQPKAFAPGSYLLCITDDGDPLSVLAGRVYQVVQPEANDPEGHVRILDEEGEDYLYPRHGFFPMNLPDEVIDTLSGALKRHVA